jgi:hypothetical protein
MTTVSDYDARRVSDVDADDADKRLRELAPARATAVVDDDPNDLPFFDLPGADLSGEELSVTVIPARSDEFTCSSCHLVQHRNRRRSAAGTAPICADCA